MVNIIADTMNAQIRYIAETGKKPPAYKAVTPTDNYTGYALLAFALGALLYG